MKLRAYAKINLGLQILDKREDGYHNIETVFHQINWYDELELERSDSGISLNTASANVPNDETNLCVHAAKLLAELSGAKAGARITLKKSIPVGAGLGGGSSDAAAVLLGLNSLWDLHLPPDRLHPLAEKLGSDVPYFLVGGTVYGTGRGETLEPIDLQLPYWILVCTPPVHISTAWAYANFRKNPYLRREDLRALVTNALSQPQVLLNKLRNDFESTVFRQYPEVMHLKEKLIRGGADFALMSGSGSSVFGFFSNERYVRELHDRLAQSYAVSLTEPYFQPQPVLS
ncbi:MAG TPA: 4-(cytidine 5'-diphospho)-2-C-methyl-D-erythritol kinase [Bacteroidota bacterium]|nr:4-(cytidine 5'-diphospho)-2-C-methyl-D-erythritol kinase [Bacteroidota bacterium]